MLEDYLGEIHYWLKTWWSFPKNDWMNPFNVIAFLYVNAFQFSTEIDEQYWKLLELK